MVVSVGCCGCCDLRVLGQCGRFGGEWGLGGVGHQPVSAGDGGNPSADRVPNCEGCRGADLRHNPSHEKRRAGGARQH